MAINLWNEKLLAFLAVVWGVTLMLPGDVFGGIQAYSLINRVFPDWLWGALYFVCGGLLFLNIPKELHKHIHWILCSLWLGMTLLVFLAGIRSVTILIGSLTFVVAMFHVGKFFRLGNTVLYLEL